METANAVGLPISVRGGGHSVAGHGSGEGALLIDLSGLRRVEIDAERRIARVQGGALRDDVDAATQAAGLAVPGGTFGDTAGLPGRDPARGGHGCRAPRRSRGVVLRPARRRLLRFNLNIEPG